jgi:hypothetical protein
MRTRIVSILRELIFDSQNGRYGTYVDSVRVVRGIEYPVASTRGHNYSPWLLLLSTRGTSHPSVIRPRLFQKAFFF